MRPIAPWWWVVRPGWKQRHIISASVMTPGAVEVQALCDRRVRLVAKSHFPGNPLATEDCRVCRRRMPGLTIVEPPHRTDADREATAAVQAEYRREYRRLYGRTS